MRRDLPSTAYGRYALFIDGSNFYHTLRDLNLHVDYRRLLAYFSQRGRLVRATYYTMLLEGTQTPDWLIRLTDWLAYNEYQVVTHSGRVLPRAFVDEAGQSGIRFEVKGKIDVALAVDMLTLAPSCDTIILASGSGEFTRLVAAVQQHGCRVVVLSSARTATSTVADELRRAADAFIDIVEITDQIGISGHKEQGTVEAEDSSL